MSVVGILHREMLGDAGWFDLLLDLVVADCCCCCVAEGQLVDFVCEWALLLLLAAAGVPLLFPASQRIRSGRQHYLYSSSF